MNTNVNLNNQKSIQNSSIQLKSLKDEIRVCNEFQSIIADKKLLNEDITNNCRNSYLKESIDCYLKANYNQEIINSYHNLYREMHNFMNHTKEIRYELNNVKENLMTIINSTKENKNNVSNNMNLFLAKMKDFNEILNDLKKLRQQVYSVKKIKEYLSNNNELNELNEKLNNILNMKESNEMKLLSLKKTEEEKKEAYENTKELLGLKDAKLNSLIEQMNSKLLNIVELDSKIRNFKSTIEGLIKEVSEFNENEDFNIDNFEHENPEILNLNTEIDNISIEIQNIINENSLFDSEYKSFIDGVNFFKNSFLEISENLSMCKNETRFNTICKLNNNSNSVNNSPVINLCFSNENTNNNLSTNNLRLNTNVNQGSNSLDDIKKNAVYFTNDKGEKNKDLIKILVYFGFFLISSIVKMNKKINDNDEIKPDINNSKSILIFSIK